MTAVILPIIGLIALWRSAGRFSRPGAVAATVAVIAAGMAAIPLLPGGSERYVAVGVAVGLIALGVAQILRAVRRPPRTAPALLGTALLLGAPLPVLWPLLAPASIGLVVAAVFLIGLLRARFAPRSGTGSLTRPLSGTPQTVLSAAALAATAVLLVASGLIFQGGTHVQPGAFYQPPADVPAEAGQLLRVEAATEGIDDGMQGWRILYTTIGGTGEPAVASATVIAALDRTEPAPVLAIGHGTTGIIPACAPSLTAVPLDGAAGAARELIGQGWVAVVTDYVGLGTDGPHPYLVGRPEAANMLDAVRAARAIDGLVLSDETVAMGHSQGGHAALWAGIIAEQYAPDVQLLGVAAFAPATDLRAIYDRIGESAAGRIVTAYQVLTSSRLDPDFDIDAIVRSGNQRAVDRLGELCFGGRDAVAALATASQISELLTPDALDRGLGDVLDKGSVVDHIPVPVLVAQGTEDTLVVPAAQREWIRERCAAGQPIDYREFEGLDHATLVADDSPLTEQIVHWVGDRLAGLPTADYCAGGPG
ncbi:lipase family protein [Millisia brevis]|uniref:lipase family protein n=1 Tax=Millisia brevis TaxID=264148 RepID=UPI00147241BF|nr:lipase family protein [Millisia brevis]